MDHKVLIANRGEIALRAMKACERLNLDYVVVYTPQDVHSLPAKSGLRKAKAWRIARYNDPNEILEVADATGCDSIYLGYGMLSENWRFIRRCQERRSPVIPLAPSWQKVRDLGSKVNTKRVAKKLNIPTTPGSMGPVRDILEAEDIVRQILVNHGPDILIKASAGGGGRGLYEMRGVSEASLDELSLKFNEAKSYARRLFHDDTILIEHLFDDFNHIEVQILGDRHGDVVHYGTRNCTIQSPQRQKRVEVAPAFDLNITYDFDPAKVMQQAVQYSLKMANKLGYDNAGTWEWIVTRDGSLYLLEVNTRIQVENDISGRISCVNQVDGVDLVVEQIRTGLGEKIGYNQENISFGNRVAIEFRIIAEDTDKDFEPWIGQIEKFEFPEHEWSAVYTHVPDDEPYQILPDYDPNLALVVVWGTSLRQAQTRGKQFLDSVVIEGRGDKPFKTNLEYLKDHIPGLLEF